MTNMDQNLINLWNNLPHPKILVYQWEAGYQPSGGETAQKLKSAIAQLFSIPEPEVGPPYAANKSTRRYSPPWCYLVTGLPAATAEQLIGQLFWTTPSIIFFAIPYAPPAYDFICTIENFTFHEDKTHKALKVVMSSILTNQQARACVLRDNPNPNAFTDTIGTVKVKQICIAIPGNSGGGTKLLWNIYAAPPSQTAAKNNEWRRIVSTSTFFTPLNGVGVIHSQPFSCYGCKSIDHPRGLCPFPQTGDWASRIPPDTASPLVPLTNPTPRGCGTRGNRARGEYRGRGHVRGRVG
jgi:hypothetical protein